MSRPLSVRSDRTCVSNRPNRQAGFTLLELMIVVVIIGVLAAIAIPTFINYVHKARTSEATTFLGEIHQRQEAYRAEFGIYANPSGGALTTFNPTILPTDGNLVAWEEQAGWRQLGAIPDSAAVRFQYAAVGGLPNTAPPVANVVRADEFWHIAHGVGDLDGDGVTVTFEITSHRQSIWTSAAGGWE